MLADSKGCANVFFEASRHATVEVHINKGLAATPGAGSYVNESDYFDTNWGDQYLGEHYSRRCAVKANVDPDGLFRGRHLVGDTDE